MVFFSFITVLINLIPNAMSCISYIAAMFGGNFHVGFISNLILAVTNVIDIIGKPFIGLDIKALNQETIAMPGCS